MKCVILLVLTFTIVFNTHSQSLTGVWEGWFLDPVNKSDTVIMKLNFSLKQDSTYDIYDFSKSGEFKAVCKMRYMLLSKNSIYLEETEVIRTNKPDRNITLQNMKLKIDKDFKTMSGRWSCNKKELRCDGAIYFFKKE